jgi:hypothetical protein
MPAVRLSYRHVTVGLAAVFLLGLFGLVSPAAHAATTTACGSGFRVGAPGEIRMGFSCADFVDHGGPYVFDIARLTVTVPNPLGLPEFRTYDNVVATCGGYDYYGGDGELAALDCLNIQY